MKDRCNTGFYRPQQGTIRFNGQGIAHYGYVMENGKIVMEGAADTLRENPDIREFYLGMSVAGNIKSYADVKSYRRRKRWLQVEQV